MARHRLQVEGIVQGVGFRPFVYNLATSLQLAGFVRNDGDGVTVEIEGPATSVETFAQRLRREPPPLARIDHVAVEPVATRHERSFTIIASHGGAHRNTLVSPDVATCDDCLRELLDPADRRYLYPFINCTNCGPRFTIIKDVPYDREKTTMAAFAMCPACRHEYQNPLDRRFHAQPNACPHCGPQALLVACDLSSVEREYSSTHSTGHRSHPTAASRAAVREAADTLAQGHIIAIKGLGGYHLACDALGDEAVAYLRRVKQRLAKPFALMVPDLQTARRLCRISDAEAELLQSRRRPIVLLQRRRDCPVAPEVAPRYDTLGLMLPYTPLHTLLFYYYKQEANGRLPVLVMTSGNAGNEPIIYRDDEARERLLPSHKVVHARRDSRKTVLLTHNRAIHARCDDSVSRIVAGGEQILRRSRGYAPEPIRLAQPFPQPVLACGAHLKNTFCLGKDHQAFLSQHIGDLENLETLLSFRQAVAHFQKLFDVRAQVVAHDLHPEYQATKYAHDHPAPHKIAVQHHHAHVASVLAEHGLQGPVIGVAADGTGYGPDGAVWGGEILIADLQDYRRVARLAYIPLPGGEQAVRQPWRVAAAYLAQTVGAQTFLELGIPFTRRLDHRRWLVLQQMIERGLNAPATSSLGRLFDAVAALLDLRQEVDYEGQAAIELEILAAAAPAEARQAYPFDLLANKSDGALPTAQASPPLLQIDPTPAIRAIVADIQDGAPPSAIAACFHETVARMLQAACRQVSQESGLRQVALSGGVFQNRLLLERLLQLLQQEGFECFINRKVPPNDGGLSLGQAAVAAARMRSEDGGSSPNWL